MKSALILLHWCWSNVNIIHVHIYIYTCMELVAGGGHSGLRYLERYRISAPFKLWIRPISLFTCSQSYMTFNMGRSNMAVPAFWFGPIQKVQLCERHPVFPQQMLPSTFQYWTVPGDTGGSKVLQPHVWTDILMIKVRMCRIKMFQGIAHVHMSLHAFEIARSVKTAVHVY